MEWITSDLHFGHKNILEFCPKTRGHYSSIDEMDLAIIEAWNYKVSPQDTVYILGDVSFRGLDTTVEILKTLSGKKILIKGNHDANLCKNASFIECFEDVYDYLEVNRNRTKIVMFHYPLLEWNKCSSGSILFHGHCHGGKTSLEEFRAQDVGFDATGEVVSNFDSLIKVTLEKKILRRFK